MQYESGIGSYMYLFGRNIVANSGKTEREGRGGNANEFTLKRPFNWMCAGQHNDLCTEPSQSIRIKLNEHYRWINLFTFEL